MIEYEFTYELPSGDELECVVSIVPGVEAHVLCLPEDAEPAESPEVNLEQSGYGTHDLNTTYLFIKDGDKFISLEEAICDEGYRQWEMEQ